MKSQRFAERDPLEDEKGERHAPKTESVARAFLELFQLLEEHAPSWYTEEIRNQAESAARILRTGAWRIKLEEPKLGHGMKMLLNQYQMVNADAPDFIDEMEYAINYTRLL
jgi:hypothetical protein